MLGTGREATFAGARVSASTMRLMLKAPFSTRPSMSGTQSSRPIIPGAASDISQSLSP